MQLHCKKIVAFFCALAMVITLLPSQVQATEKPKFAKNYTTLYENGANKGVYTYKIQKLTKGQKVKWSVSGTGKRYVKLKKTTTSVRKTSSVNSIIVKTKGKTAAKNKKVFITAKVYSRTGRLQYTLKTKTAKIKVRPTKIVIVDNGYSTNKFYVGKSYQFQYQITPANATSSIVWTATDETGNCVNTMGKGGSFKPDKEGKYKIKVQAIIGSKVVKEASTSITVGTSMTGVKQTAANKVVACYSGNAKELVKKGNFTVRNAAGARVEVKAADFSSDGTEVTLTTYDLFNDGASYSVTDGQMNYDFTASVGKPVSLKILTTQVTVGRETPIEYALYDANNVDVQAAYPGEITYSEKITNGYRTKDNKIYMTEEGTTGVITITYRCKDKTIPELTDTATIVCVAANTASNTNLTLTAGETTPNYAAVDYKDNRSAASGSNYYVHFRALDTDGSEIKYDSVKFESSDPDVLVINNGKNNVARATAIKTGKVNIIVTASYAKKNYTYSYEISISEPAYLSVISASQSQITMSNVYVSGYKGYINISAADQYGQPIVLSNETAQIVENGTNKASMATYDAATDRMIIDASGRAAGTYNYTLTLTMNGHQASANVTVTVQTPPYNGANTYCVDLDNSALDLAISSDMTTEALAAAKVVKVRLAEYRGGVFYNYVPIQSVKITKDGKYYGLDLTKGGSSTDPKIGGASSELALSAVSFSGNVCTKAQTGTYNIELKFYPDGQTSLGTMTGSLNLKDSQADPQISVEHTVSTKACKNALELAQNCLSVQGVNGEIISCEVTGSNTTGSAYAVASGDSVNIKSVGVQVTTTLSDKKIVVSNYTVSVGKTLKNQ
ncbi:MAG: hypothetical protein SO130_06240 [Agathobacter sp.]|nr:hypothetical protein [Agathobacter sp.]